MNHSKWRVHPKKTDFSLISDGAIRRLVKKILGRGLFSGKCPRFDGFANQLRNLRGPSCHVHVGITGTNEHIMNYSERGEELN